MTENIYTILNWVFGTLVAIMCLFAVNVIAPSTGWEEEKETKKSS